MKKLLFIFSIFFTIVFQLQSQIAPNKYFVYFTDKDHSEYTTGKPEQFLSEKTIERRATFNIAITEEDLPVSQYYIDSLEKFELQVYYASKWLNGVLIYSDKIDLFDDLKKISFIDSITIIPDLKNLTSNDKFNIENTISDQQLESSITQIDMLNGNFLHNLGYTGKNIDIGIFDSGFWDVDNLNAFESVRNNQQIKATLDIVDMDDKVFEEHSHGMKVFSIMAGYVENELQGSAPDANYWLIRTEDANSEYVIEEYNWVRAAEFADSVGIDIINTSLGYSTFDNPAQNHTYADMNGKTTIISKAAETASTKGILVVVSAGNSGASSWKYISAPADADHILAIGATNSNREYAYFSSVGPSSDDRVKPDVSAMGYETLHQSTANTIVPGNGTSFSAPIISGLAACLWQAFPSASNAEIRQMIIESAHQFNTPDFFLGYGIPDFRKALETNNINFPDHSKDVHIFPNPFTNYLELSSNKLLNTQEVDIRIIDINGSIVYQIKKKVLNNKIHIDGLQSLNSGLYILSIESSSEISRTLILKQSN